MEETTPLEEKRDQDANAMTPPGYSEATTPNTSQTPTVHRFIRHSRLSSKVFVESNNVDRYCFVADTNKQAKVWMHAGASTQNSPLGFLTFPDSHNAFRMHFGTNLDTFTNVRARIGYPHPKSFSFKTASTVFCVEREMVWTHRSGDVSGSPPALYDLSFEGSHIALATLSVTKKHKSGTTLQWHAEPESELEQAFVILSAIGVITRMLRKAKYREIDNNNNGLPRWFSFWWMSALSTAAIG